MALAGGIDLGGTKIDARFFDPEAGWALGQHRERPTPADYDDLVAALAEEVTWLQGLGAGTVGVGAPGLIAPGSGRMLTANLPATGHSILEDLHAATGLAVPVINDCRAFTLSEAHLGAGRGHAAVMGLIIGTGLAGGFALNGRLMTGPNGQAGEYGHMAIAGAALADAGLDALACGCGRTGCYETYCSGPGLSRLARHLTGVATSPEALGGAADTQVLDLWARLLAQMLVSCVLSLDPEVIVLGGGLSNLPDVTGRLSAALTPELLAGTTAPAIVLAEGGDRSGARGAALHAWMTGKVAA